MHLFEIMDQGWFPKNLRNHMTDYLEFLAAKFDIFKPATPIIVKALQKSGQSNIIDLCSGGGGAWPTLIRRVKEEVPETQVMLTDLFPNEAAFTKAAESHQSIKFSKESVNALHVDPKLEGVRTQFLSFHHFRPDEARQILQNAVDSKATIAVFEAQERSVLAIPQFILTPLIAVLLMPFVKPRRLDRLMFTYALPILPICITWDGIVSLLRTYSVSEMKKLVQDVQDHDQYTWDIGRLKSGPGVILYLLGYPKEA